MESHLSRKLPVQYFLLDKPESEYSLGYSLRYSGITDIYIFLPGSNNHCVCPTAVLVVENTSYNRQIPFFIVTNVVTRCLEFSISTENMSEPWKLAYRNTVESKSDQSDLLDRYFVLDKWLFQQILVLLFKVLLEVYLIFLGL